MSQDDQRHQPNEEPEEAARQGEAVAEPTRTGAGETMVTSTAGAVGEAAAGTGAAEGGTAEEPGAAEEAGAETDTGTGTGGAHIASTSAMTVRDTAMRREFHEPGEGAARYAAIGEEVPRAGSEQSWSAQPHPGYQADPAAHVTTKRLLSVSLIGVVVLAAGAFFGYSLLLKKSGNGNGPAPWTAAVKQNGAVVGGINAQNNNAASPVDLPAGAVFGNSGTTTGAVINQAVAACRTATATSVPVTAATGTGAEISSWATRATPTVVDLHSAAGVLQRALTTKDVLTVASAAVTLCDGYPAIAKVPPMPDAVGSQAWSAAVQAYATAAVQSLRGVSGTYSALPAANDSINLGNAELVALQARIVSAT